MPDETRHKSMRKRIDNAAGGMDTEAFVNMMKVAKSAADNYNWNENGLGDDSDDDLSEDESEDASDNTQMRKLKANEIEGAKQQAELAEKLRIYLGNCE